MMKMAVPLTLIICAFLAYVIYMWYKARSEKREFDHKAQKDRDEWIDKQMRGDL